MTIKVFVVTYDNAEALNTAIEGIREEDASGHDVRAYVINNHTRIDLRDTGVTVLNNVLRPDWSTGHLARNWNQAILNGFKSLNEPACDILVCAQEDTIFDKGWVKGVISAHQNFDFVAYCLGDGCCSYSANAVKRIGLWDERFCGITHQEYDYFLRAMAYNKERSSIYRLLNGRNMDFIRRPAHEPNAAHLASNVNHQLTRKLFMEKWGIDPDIEFPSHIVQNPPRPLIPNFIMYPYFEKDVDDLRGKNYLTCD